MTASLTTSGALKKMIEAGGGVTVFRSVAPADTAPPFVTVTERISFVPDSGTSLFDPNSPNGFIEQAQVDVWQARRSTAQGSNALAENATLAKTVIKRLHGKKTVSGDTINGEQAVSIRVINAIRQDLEKDNLIRDIITVEIRQELGA